MEDYVSDMNQFHNSMNNESKLDELYDSDKEVESGFLQFAQDRGYRAAALTEYPEEEAVGRKEGYLCAVNCKSNSYYVEQFSKLDGILTLCQIKCTAGGDNKLILLKKRINCYIKEFYFPPEATIQSYIDKENNSKQQDFQLDYDIQELIEQVKECCQKANLIFPSNLFSNDEGVEEIDSQVSNLNLDED